MSKQPRTTKKTRAQVSGELDPVPVSAHRSGAAVVRPLSLIESFFAERRSGAAVAPHPSGTALAMAPSRNPIEPSNKIKRSVVEGDVRNERNECLCPKFGPDTWEVALFRGETARTKARERLNYQRAKEASIPYRREFDIILRRITRLVRDHDLISKKLKEIQLEELKNSIGFHRAHHGGPGSRSQTLLQINKKDIEQLRNLYTLELIQKEEEHMRLRDRVRDIQKIIIDIYREYELEIDLTDHVLIQRDILNSIIPGSYLSRCNYGGGQSKTEKYKYKRSRKYNRIIKNNHQYRFSQRNKSNYGRKNATKKW